ncbi:acyl-[acyl-carrier-protein] thioesterase [Pontiella sulfatireligans]|nr:acyl-ACP thioesterase domain-containing protein [Pontiella sulfatireligans]
MDSNLQPEWSTEHTICSFDVDPQLTARLPALCGFMQEAAYHHAEHLGLGHSQLSAQSLAWVLSRQRIEISRLPAWGESIKVRTWPSGRDRLFFYRDFEIADESGGLILLASTAWFVINTEKRERVHSDFYLNIDLPDVGAHVFSAKLERLKGCSCEGGDPMAVNYGDLDMNGHVNNIRYIEWVLSSLPLEFHQTHSFESLEVNYLAEAVYGHDVSVCTEPAGSFTWAHVIRAKGDDLFRARTVWQGKQAS